MVFMDINGTEIDRIIGYLPPDLFLEELKRIHSGKGTFPDLKNKLYNDSTNFSILFELSQKYATMGDKNTAHIYIRKILNNDIDSSGTAYFYDLLYTAQESSDPGILIEYADNTINKDKRQKAYWEGMILLRKQKSEPKREADIFFKYIQLLELPSSGILNNFAWRMTELDINLDIALNKINLALSKKNKPQQLYMYLDTKAEVLWKLNRVEEALVEIEKCVQGEPDNKYYREQKEKFLGLKV